MTEILDRVRAALSSEPRLDLHKFPIGLGYVDGTLTLEGEVGDIAVKKLALERAAALSEVTGILDRLRVRPAQRMGDGAIRDLVRDALLQEPAFADFAIRRRLGDLAETLREPPEARGVTELEVEDGVVTLNGQVPGLDDKLLAGVLAWWVPGSRDVINGIAVEPPEGDSDDAILEAVRLVLEKDPFVNASQIRVGVRRAAVTLLGLVPSEAVARDGGVRRLVRVRRRQGQSDRSPSLGDGGIGASDGRRSSVRRRPRAREGAARLRARARPAGDPGRGQHRRRACNRRRADGRGREPRGVLSPRPGDDAQECRGRPAAWWRQGGDLRGSQAADRP